LPRPAQDPATKPVIGVQPEALDVLKDVENLPALKHVASHMEKIPVHRHQEC
jgi:hypothetical protein